MAAQAFDFFNKTETRWQQHADLKEDRIIYLFFMFEITVPSSTLLFNPPPENVLFKKSYSISFWIRNTIVHKVGDGNKLTSVLIHFLPFSVESFTWAVLIDYWQALDRMDVAVFFNIFYCSPSFTNLTLHENCMSTLLLEMDGNVFTHHLFHGFHSIMPGKWEKISISCLHCCVLELESIYTWAYCRVRGQWVLLFLNQFEKIFRLCLLSCAFVQDLPNVGSYLNHLNVFLVQFWFMKSSAFGSAIIINGFRVLQFRVEVNIRVQLDLQGDVLRDFDIEWDLVSVVLASGLSFTPRLKLADHGLGYLQEWSNEQWNGMK